jgi:hypothetical protein
VRKHGSWPVPWYGLLDACRETVRKAPDVPHGVALRATEKLRFGSFRAPYADQNHGWRVAPIPFRTVSTSTSFDE